MGTVRGIDIGLMNLKPKIWDRQRRNFIVATKKLVNRLCWKSRINPSHHCFTIPFGFVAGCIWGDDSSWKIEFLDLSAIANGVIKRDARFGYIEMPEGMSLKQAINMDDFSYDLTDEISYVTIALQKRFELASGKMIDDEHFA